MDINSASLRPNVLFVTAFEQSKRCSSQAENASSNLVARSKDFS
jgi:hypothetical protein